MNKKIKITTLIALTLILLTTVFGVGMRVGAAGNTPGSMGDPLITESYLNQVLANYSKTPFTCQTIKNGKTESFNQGAVIVLYSGTCVSTGTLLDLSTGTSIDAQEKLVKYHQYLVPSDNTGITTTSLSVLFIQQ